MEPPQVFLQPQDFSLPDSESQRPHQDAVPLAVSQRVICDPGVAADPLQPCDVPLVQLLSQQLNFSVRHESDDHFGSGVLDNVNNSLECARRTRR